MKIELSEVENYVNALRVKLEQKGGSLMTHEQIEFIAAALEQLPKLVVALRKLHAAYAWSKGEETPEQTAALDEAYLALGEQALEPFTTNQLQP